MVEFVMTGTCVRVPKRAVSSLGLEGGRHHNFPVGWALYTWGSTWEGEKKTNQHPFHHTVDGSEIRLTKQLRLVKSPHDLPSFSTIPGGWPWDFGTINNIFLESMEPGSEKKGRIPREHFAWDQISQKKIRHPENKSRGVFFSPPKMNERIGSSKKFSFPKFQVTNFTHFPMDRSPWLQQSEKKLVKGAGGGPARTL